MDVARCDASSFVSKQPGNGPIRIAEAGGNRGESVPQRVRRHTDLIPLLGKCVRPPKATLSVRTIFLMPKIIHIFYRFGRLCRQYIYRDFCLTVGVAVSLKGIFDANQLTELTSILDEHCQAAGYDDGHPEREHLAHRLITMFQGGTIKREDLMAALKAGLGDDRQV